MAKRTVEEIIADIETGKHRSFLGGVSSVLTPKEIFKQARVPKAEQFSFKVKPIGMAEYNELKVLLQGDNQIRKMVNALAKLGKTLNDLFLKDDDGFPTGEVDKELEYQVTAEINSNRDNAREAGEKAEEVLREYVTHIIVQGQEVEYSNVAEKLNRNIKEWLYSEIVNSNTLTDSESEVLE